MKMLGAFLVATLVNRLNANLQSEICNALEVEQSYVWSFEMVND